MTKPLSLTQYRILLARQVSTWRGRIAHVEEHGGPEPMEAADVYQLLQDQAQMFEKLAGRIPDDE